MDKIWLKSYPPGVPAEINPDEFQSVVEVLEKSAQQYPHEPAYYSMGVTLTYDQVDTFSRHFAAYLQHGLKAQKGDRIAIMMPNLLQYPITMFGALRAGLIVVNINPLYTPDELLRQINDSGTETIVVLESFAGTVQKALPNMPTLKNIIVTQAGDMLPVIKAVMIDFAVKHIQKKVPAWHIPGALYFKTLLSLGKKLPFHPQPLHNRDTAFLQYTGGTTGVSKGAVLTHRNLIANIMQGEVWFRPLESDQQEIAVTALPLYHIFSLMGCLYCVKTGVLNVLITNPRDIPGFIKTLKKFKFSALFGVNTLFSALLKHPQFSTLDFSQLRVSLGGGMATQAIVAEKWQKVTKAPLLEAYGLTECSPGVTVNPINLKGYNGTAGLPLPSTDVCILSDDGHPLPVGRAGELAVKGPQVMEGYWNNPHETAKAFTLDGWLLTGDIARMDSAGFVTILERKKDMILVSGFNVYPNEIEDVLVRLPGVREAAVISVADDSSGEAPKAFIVKDDQSLTVHDVIRYCREHLTPYKVPKHIEFREELPKTNVGKILRRALRDPVPV